jgi:hypothetical protein
MNIGIAGECVELLCLGKGKQYDLLAYALYVLLLSVEGGRATFVYIGPPPLLLEGLVYCAGPAQHVLNTVEALHNTVTYRNEQAALLQGLLKMKLSSGKLQF